MGISLAGPFSEQGRQGRTKDLPNEKYSSSYFVFPREILRTDYHEKRSGVKILRSFEHENVRLARPKASAI